MSRRSSGPRRGPTGDTRVKDSVDHIVAEWAVERPDLPVRPVEVLTRLSRVRMRIDDELAGVFARYDLSGADFAVIAALRRSGSPFTLPQSVLMTRLGLTSGTISVRLGRLETKGVVTRAPSSDDGRGVLVTLTDKGAQVFDEIAPAHLANEDLLLSALTVSERDQLAALLHKLLVSFEHEQSTSPLGFTVIPAHLARRARIAVGLSDQPGLLVQHVETGSPAHTAGLKEGDLIIALACPDGHDNQALVSCVDLARAASATTADQPSLRLRVLRGEQAREVLLRRPDGVLGPAG